MVNYNASKVEYFIGNGNASNGNGSYYDFTSCQLTLVH